jgi:hypothetical protein
MATTADDVWRLLGELTEAQQETERTFQETDRLLKEQSQETDRQIQATIQENRQANQQLSDQLGALGNQLAVLGKQLGALGGAWGRFVEDLVAPACERLFVERGIPVCQVSQRVRRRRQGDTLEIDVLVVNQGHVLAVEVKSSLSVADVKEFVADLEQFRDFFPEYASMQLYGAVAGMGIESGADRYAYRQGLFVLAQSGETVVILNDTQFQPRAW